MKNTVVTLQKQKHEHDKITMVTAYDYTTAKIMDESGVNTILVGDSLGMVMLGYEDTLSVTMEDMIHHTAAVTRGAMILPWAYGFAVSHTSPILSSGTVKKIMSLLLMISLIL